jgi:hypothetical protein
VSRAVADTSVFIAREAGRALAGLRTRSRCRSSAPPRRRTPTPRRKEQHDTRAAGQKGRAAIVPSLAVAAVEAMRHASSQPPTLCRWRPRCGSGWPSTPRPPAGVAERVRDGEDLRFAVREFLDEFALLPRDDLRRAAIGRRPLATGAPRADAYLGAFPEHLAASAGLDRPSWSVEDGRFRERFLFPSAVPGFRALAIAESPAAFRRRGIFISPARHQLRRAAEAARDRTTAKAGSPRERDDVLAASWSRSGRR